MLRNSEEIEVLKNFGEIQILEKNVENIGISGNFEDIEILESLRMFGMLEKSGKIKRN